jgi:short-subunit dehydrogenase
MLFSPKKVGNRHRWTIVSLLAAAVVGGIRWRRDSKRKFELAGKRIVVMGGSRGLGLLMAQEFVRQGSEVVVTARDLDELVRADELLVREAGRAATGARRASAGFAAGAITCDVADPVSVAAAIGAAHARLGGIDVLVNCAGMIQVGPFDAMNAEDYEKSLAVHFRGPLTATLAVVDEMRKRRSGRIVNISSIGGLVAIPHLLPYSAGKFALTGWSEGLRAELARDGVYVTTVCPGLMRTGSTYNALFKSRHREEHAWFTLGAATPLTSMNARRAAKLIVRACRRGTPFVILGWQAKVLAAAHALAPASVIGLLSFVNQLLPSLGGIGHRAALGSESGSAVAPSLLTALDAKAARENNELHAPSNAPSR